MKILAVMGSPKARGKTYLLARQVEQAMAKLGKVEFDYLFLAESDLKMCKGCYACLAFGENRCPLRDDRAAIEQKMMDADGVIFASPVYVMNVSGLMKNFIDRFAYRCHRPRFFDKKAMVLATTGGVGTTIVLEILAQSVMTWGFDVNARVGGAVAPDATPEAAIAIYGKRNDAIEAQARKFYHSIESGIRPRPSLLRLATFEAQRKAFSTPGKTLPADLKYWSENGWSDPRTNYYYASPVSPISVGLAKLLSRAATRNY